jgi:anti-sigma factor RsiW
MKQETAQNQTCPRIEIAAYVDGELNPREELDLEMHLAGCTVCCDELNEQKKLLCALDFALDNKAEIELPENFTKVVVATAESNVKGLRCPQERNRALFVCAALLLIAIFGLGAETSKNVEMLGNLGEQFLAVGGFVVRLIHDITIAATVVLRSLCLQFVFKSAIYAAVLGMFFVLSLLVFSRLISRHRRF